MWLFASLIMVICGIGTAITLQWMDAPYGKFGPDKSSIWGPLIPAHWAWCIQESPAFFMMIYSWLVLADSSHANLMPNQILAGLFCFHYFVRSFIFPFLLNQSKPSPLLIVVFAFFFCICNGTLQGTYLFLSPDSITKLSGAEWLSLWRVRLGILLFLVGWVGNQHADYVLRHLRDAKPGDQPTKNQPTKPSQRYHIPYGGLFKFTSAANYTGELIEWFGFALAAWSIPAFAFFIFTLTYLVPRGVSYHRWYRQTFPSYPPNRKAVIPFLL